MKRTNNEEGWKDVKNKKKNNKKNTNNNKKTEHPPEAANLRNARSGKEAKLNQMILNLETTKEDESYPTTVKTTEKPGDYKLKKEQVIFSNFPENTSLFAMESFLKRRGLLRDVNARIQMFLCCRKFSGLLVTYSDEETAITHTIMAGNQQLRYKHGDRTKKIDINCFHGDSGGDEVKYAYVKIHESKGQ